jgi:hypothetical protein
VAAAVATRVAAGVVAWLNEYATWCVLHAVLHHQFGGSVCMYGVKSALGNMFVDGQGRGDDTTAATAAVILRLRYVTALRLARLLHL